MDKWVDNNYVVIVRNFDTITPTTGVKRWIKEKIVKKVIVSGKYTTVQQPNGIDIYNKFIGAFDLHGNAMNNYRIGFRSM